jgi:2-oxoglutarate dehydrogenase E1 component
VADSSHDNPLEAFGDNEWLVDEMHEQYKKDPSSVDEAWGTFFASQSGSGNGRSAEAKADAAKPRTDRARRRGRTHLSTQGSGAPGRDPQAARAQG